MTSGTAAPAPTGAAFDKSLFCPLLELPVHTSRSRCPQQTVGMPVANFFRGLLSWMGRCYALARANGVFRRSMIISLVVGTVLTFINQGDMLVKGHPPPLWKVALTYTVPFLVSCHGAMGAILKKERDAGAQAKAQTQAHPPALESIKVKNLLPVIVVSCDSSVSTSQDSILVSVGKPEDCSTPKIEEAGGDLDVADTKCERTTEFGF